MPKIDFLANEWTSPQFLLSPRKAREAYWFVATARSPALPPGLVWYAGEKDLAKHARRAGIRIPQDLEPLCASGFIREDPATSLILMPSILLGNLIQSYTPRNVISWSKRLDLFPDSEIKKAWLSMILSVSKEKSGSLFKKISETFGGSDFGSENPGSDAVILVRYFAEIFEVNGYGSYVANWGKEIAIAKSLLETLDVEEIKKRIDLYFKDEWLKSKASLVPINLGSL